VSSTLALKKALALENFYILGLGHKVQDNSTGSDHNSFLAAVTYVGATHGS